MNPDDGGFEIPDHVEPDQLALLLGANGWQQKGGVAGRYSMWSPRSRDDDRRHPRSPSILLPLDVETADYHDLLDQALGLIGRLAVDRQHGAEWVWSRLWQAPGDELKFRKDVPTIRGAVPWEQGESLFASARGILAAGAKARLSRQAYYGNSNGTFATKFLESVLMGQTEVGSYVVTAFAPPSQAFPEVVARKPERLNLPGVAEHTGRQVVESIVAGLEGVQEAISHFAKSASLEAFVAHVEQGVSYELVKSLNSLVSETDGAEVTVEWSPEVEVSVNRRDAGSVSRFEFAGGSSDVLRRAADRLAAATPPQSVRARGVVTVVSRPKPGEPGVVRMKVEEGSEAGTISVRLTEDQFEIATEAIRAQVPVIAAGRQEKEGRSYWLYDVTTLRIDEVKEHEPEDQIQYPAPSEG